MDKALLAVLALFMVINLCFIILRFMLLIGWGETRSGGHSSDTLMEALVIELFMTIAVF